ncbi:3'-5' exonuclease [Coraliomargarita sinensis]|uniref:3'-5' exonuclease n=1 Tax=Coraliomargarita sinensis TaxID=2174842 RepID=A0A317ZMH1_9BACT|nr:3'-5' exonuclease [Coraliomargarita sinensis]PXA05138.1 3'-5' exonuclease [Coraliomargarita sinensis]
MSATPIHVIDFEGSRQSGVVEYGVATLAGRSITATYSRICAPVGTISDLDRAQHGINEELAGTAEAFDREWTLFSGLRKEGPFCAHNVAVEAGLIATVWPYPKKCPNFAEPEAEAADWGPWLDTLRLYRRIYPGMESYGLEFLVKVFDLEEELDRLAQLHCPPHRRRYHCALYDAMASALLLARLFSEPELESASLRWLILQSASSESQRESMGQQELL